MDLFIQYTFPKVRREEVIALNLCIHLATSFNKVTDISYLVWPSTPRPSYSFDWQILHTKIALGVPAH